MLIIDILITILIHILIQHTLDVIQQVMKPQVMDWADNQVSQTV